VAWRDVEGLARRNLQWSVFRVESEPSADYVALVTTLAHVVGQSPEQRRRIDRLVDPPELRCDVPGLDPADFPYTLLREDNFAIASAERSHVVLL
jgi:hypothetical protein